MDVGPKEKEEEKKDEGVDNKVLPKEQPNRLAKESLGAEIKKPVSSDEVSSVPPTTDVYVLLLGNDCQDFI